MNSLDLLVLETEAKWIRARRDYEQAFVSAHENFPDAPNILDCIAPHILDAYFRTTEDLSRVRLMRGIFDTRK